MYEGTLYGQWEALVTFQQMIVLCDADGMIDMTPQAIASRTSIPLRIIKKGIEILEAPDAHSRTPDQEGRRIERIDAHRPWGWHLVNHAKYMAMQDADAVRAQTRERVRRHRENKALTNGVTNVTPGNDRKRHTDIDIDTNKDRNTDTDRKGQKEQVRSRGSRLPQDWAPDQGQIDFCRQERPDLDPATVAARFRDYWIAQPGTRGSKVDWLATWRNWVRNEKRSSGRLSVAEANRLAGEEAQRRFEEEQGRAGK